MSDDPKRTWAAEAAQVLGCRERELIVVAHVHQRPVH
jgi:hypothetical protein